MSETQGESNAEANNPAEMICGSEKYSSAKFLCLLLNTIWRKVGLLKQDPRPKEKGG